MLGCFGWLVLTSLRFVNSSSDWLMSWFRMFRLEGRNSGLVTLGAIDWDERRRTLPDPCPKHSRSHGRALQQCVALEFNLPCPQTYPSFESFRFDRRRSALCSSPQWPNLFAAFSIFEPVSHVVRRWVVTGLDRHWTGAFRNLSTQKRQPDHPRRSPTWCNRVIPGSCSVLSCPVLSWSVLYR